MSSLLEKILGASAILLIILCLSMISFLKLYNFNTYKIVSLSQISFPKRLSISAWVWKPVIGTSLSDFNKDFAFAKQEGISELYLTMDEYIDLSEQSNKEKARRDVEEFTIKLTKILQLANKHGIDIHGVIGNPKYVEEKFSYIPNEFLEFVINFNKLNKYKLKSLQFDIEYYNSNSYAESRKILTSDYLHLIQQLTNNANNKIPIGIAIPYWFAEERSNFYFNYQQNNLTQHLVNIMSKNSNNYIVVMAYRESSEGINGSLNISKSSFENIDNPGLPFIFAIDTILSKEKGISYYGKTKKNLKIDLMQIDSYYRNNKNLRGVAINDLRGYQALK